MHVVLVQANNSNPKVVHASENQKRTACGIYYTKAENLKSYPTIGEMSDVMQITCEKCKNVIAKHLIRESNKEMAAQLKEEQRMLKRERSASKHHHGAEPAPAPAPNQGGEYIPPSMRKSMAQPQRPIDTPPPAPISIPAPNVAPNAPAAATAEDALSQFAIPVPGAPVVPQAPAAPVPAPAPVPVNDVLAQFAIPAGGAPAVPQAPAAPAPAPAPVPVNDVLAQFAIPAGGAPAVPQAPAAPAPAPAPVPVNDVLAQFAIPAGGAPAVPQAPAAPAPAPVPVNDVLAQFAIPAGSAPAVPQAPAAPAPAPVPADDVLAQFAVPSVPTAPAAPVQTGTEDILAQFAAQKPAGDTPVLSSTEDILAQFSGGQPAPVGQPVPHDLPTVDAEIDELKTLAANAFARPEKPVDLTPVAPQSVEDALDDLLLMPSDPSVPKLNQPSVPTIDEIPSIATVPSAPTPAAVPNAFTAPHSVPELNVPPVPPAPPVPQMPVPPMQQPAAVPTIAVPHVPQMQQPVHNSLFSVPSKLPQHDPNTRPPLFVGYGADGHQVFQTFDAAGNPIPITEPVYSAPPEQPKYNPAAEANAMMNQAIQTNGPVLDMDELMASMGIETPAQKKQKMDSGKPINFTEYKIPEKKQKKKQPVSAQSRSAMPKLEAESGPISAAEAKRRKKVDKINKEFEKQLRSRGIDPKTGGIILDKK
ncbi:MAG: hypothetical protein IKI77_07255 [Oscillospiraceae bacterium]|nr:hypothetical protein [Oscillospiraceae bacterium]